MAKMLFRPLSRALVAVSLVGTLSIAGARLQAHARADERAETKRRSPIAGLIPAPKELPGGVRWQIVTLRPRGTISCFDLSADGKWAAFADDATVRICEVKGFVLRQLLVGHQGRVQAVAWSGDATQIATASADGTARVWKADGTPIAVLRGHAGTVTDVVWSRDGRSLATCGDDATIRLWRSNGTAGAVVRGSDAPVNCLAFSPDGKRVAAGDDDHIVWIWNVDGTRVAKCEGHHGAVRSLDWTRDGRLIASGSAGYVPRDGQGGGMASIRLWGADGHFVRSLEGHTNSITSVRFSLDGTRLLSASSYRIREWTSEGRDSGTYIGEKGVILRWLPDGARFVAASPQGIAIYDRALNRRERPDSLAHKNGLPIEKITRFEKALWNPAGQGLAAMTLDGKLRFFDLAGRSIRTVGAAPPTDLHADFAWRHDGKELAVGGARSEISVFGLDGREIRRISIRGQRSQALRVEWSPDDKSILVASFVNPLLISSDGARQRVLVGHKKFAEALAWSPDGKRFATGSMDSTVRLWNVDDEKSQVLEGSSGDVDSLAWSPDGKWIAAGTDDGSWHLWKSDGTPGLTRTGHVDSIAALAFSPDSQLVATAGWDFKIRLWNASGAGNEPLCVLEDHVAPVYCVAWSPDGKRLLSASRDNTLRIWNVETRVAERIILSMTDGTTATFSSTGELIDGKPAALEKDLRYVIERDGRIQLVTPSQFNPSVTPAAPHGS